MNPTQLNRLFSILLVGLAAQLLAASAGFAAFEPPPGYYNTATGTGSTLKSQLHDIIDGHVVRSYGDARLLLQVTDQDPNDPDNIILVYNRTSLDVSGLFASGIPGWDSGASWNREHTWPRSRGVNSSGPDNSDLHQLRPSNPSINSSRGNNNFGGAFGQPFGNVNDGGTKWYPGDADAGMIARQQFYMAVRYDRSDTNTIDLELSNGNPGTSSGLGDLSRLIEWHFAATPDEFERSRNQTVFSFQNNRNPFVDHPEWAWSVLIDQQNDSQIGIAGGTSSGNGATSLDVDLGRVFVNSAVPAAQNVTLNKAGLDGTYYEVTASGDATSSLSGGLNAFLSSTTDSEVVTVGLSTSTAASGQRSGAVMIDNLDITTAGGAGRGANDGDDTINITLDVIDHATPSFDGFVETTTLTHDFGTLVEGDADGLFNYDLFNLATNPLFTADVELTGVTGSGDTSRFVNSLTPLSGAIAGGQSEAEFASFLTDLVGSFSASYTLSFAEESLPGSQVFELTLNLEGEIIAAVIPEPSAFLIVLVGVIGGITRRRR